MTEPATHHRVMQSEYMLWAKKESHARFNLAASGMVHYPLAGLPVKIADLELSGPSYYGYEPLQTALAAKCGVSRECVVAATGASMATHLALAAFIEPGTEILIEHPAYELLVSMARYLGADVKRFARRPDEGFRLDPAEIERQITPRTRLVVITNLHNPSSAFVDEEILIIVGAIARRRGARVLVDEIYLEAAFDRAPRSAFHLGPEFIVTSSLTKVYGLSGLRCGWVLAEPALAERIWRLNDLFGVIPAHPAELLSCSALENLEVIAARSRGRLEENASILNAFFAGRPDLESREHRWGTVAFPRLRRGSVDELCVLLKEKYETSVVPGRFFEMPDHMRIGIVCEPVILAEGLARLGQALDELEC